jgi:hypothetical protein
MALKLVRRFGRNVVEAPIAGVIESLKDLKGVQVNDPGPETSIDEAINWLAFAQDNSISRDGGVASIYSYIRGWGPSYPETTGYIIPTFIKYAKDHNNEQLVDRAEKMLNWLVSIQFPEGAFQAGAIGVKPSVPCTFNTGQILIGLSEGVRTFGNRYKDAMRRAADWLVITQDADGCWRKFPTPFDPPGERTYETHVALGLLEAYKADNNEKYLTSALLNVDWALRHQNDNGWFDKCCLHNPAIPLTHAIGYLFRGIIEAYLQSNDQKIFNACVKLADGLLGALKENGFLPGRLSAKWEGAVASACLTGSVQIADCWFSMYKLTHKEEYLNGALLINKFVRRTQKTGGPLETRGAIKGSFPIYGDYCRYAYLNWAAKFFIDSNATEIGIMAENSRNSLRGL